MLSVVPIVTPTRIPARRPYVLLVDDHVPSLRDLSRVVKSAGYACATAVSATEALLHCDACRPRVVVTDLSMPNLDGLGLAGWISNRYPSIPMILMTGQSLDEARIQELERTFTAVLTKPLDVDWFLNRLDRLMPRSSRFDPPLTASAS